MTWTRGMLDGAVLAGTLCGDREGVRVRAALPPACARALGERFAALDALEPEERHTALRELAGRLRPLPTPDAGRLAPARARALLASDRPPAIAARWLADAPPPRRGYVPPPGLRDVVRRVLAHDAVPEEDESQESSSPDAREEIEWRE